MSLNERVFYIVPLAATLCNLFLLLTFLTAKKDKSIKAFIYLLCAFTLWTSGSLFMRLSLFPGVVFWYEVSVTGIFLVPFCLYNFVYHFTGSREIFTKTLFGVLTAVTVALNYFDVFMEHPQIVNANGEKVFNFIVKWPSVFPIILALAVLGGAAKNMQRAIKNGVIIKEQFYPVIFGTVVMFLGSIIDMIPVFSTFPNDTFACMINSICIYYALYKKRLIRLTQLASSAPAYLVTTTFTALVLVAAHGKIEQIFDDYFAEFAEHKTLIIAVVFAVFTIVVYTVIKKLMQNLFVKTQKKLELELKEFSGNVSKTLDINDIAASYSALAKDNIGTDTVYVLIADEKYGCYRMIYSTDPLKDHSFFIVKNSPICKYLMQKGESVLYSSYKKSVAYKAMWEDEKWGFENLKIELAVPFISDDTLLGMALLTGKAKDKNYSFGERTFLESASAIAAIAIKNASLYETIKHEVQIDSLTGVFNRKYFFEKFASDFDESRDKACSLVYLNIDDLKLFNELYGTEEGDRALMLFAESCRDTIRKNGTVGRLGGKEFAVSLPFCTAGLAYEYVEKIRAEFEKKQTEIERSFTKTLTFSAGICSYPVGAVNISQMTTNADMAVYSAKRGGKNKTVIYTVADDLENGGKNIKNIALEYAPTIYALTAAIDAKDHYTFNHSQNVSKYATVLAEYIGLNEDHVEIIRQAGLLHDIGKIGIPEAILSKNSRLTDEEYEVMKKHVEGSISMIKHLPSLDYVIPSAVSHHERWDGKGYPRGIAGEAIPIGGRCLALADAFDAMVSKRSYKSPMSIEDAVAEIKKNLGKQFDPDLGIKFIELIEDGKIVPENHQK